MCVSGILRNIQRQVYSRHPVQLLPGPGLYQTVAL